MTAAAVSDESGNNVADRKNAGKIVPLVSFFVRYGLLIFVCWQLAQISWWVAGYEDHNYRLILPVDSGSVKHQGTTNVASAIGLFGSANTVEKTSAPAAVEAPETRLRLELRGVFTGGKKGGSGAIVAEKGRDGIYYRVGEKLPGNAELVEVYDDRVMLRRLGKMETLRFPESSKRSSGTNRTVSSTRRRPSDIKTPEQFLSEAERRLSKDPIGALNSVGLRPVASGDSKGYVYNGRNPMLRQMNLKKGDIIRSVNGYPMGDVQKDRELLKQFYEQGTVMVEIERDGTFFSINYPLR